MSDEDLREECGCGCAVFMIFYDPRAQGRYVACADCGKVFRL